MMIRFQTLCVAAVVSLSACSPSPHRSEGQPSEHSAGSDHDTLSAKEFDLAVAGSPAFEALRKLLPDEYGEVAKQITSTINAQTTDDAMRSELRSAIRRIRTKNADSAARASDALKVQWLNERIASLEALRIAKGAEICGAYAKTGIPSPADIELIKPYDDRIAALEFAIIADGRIQLADVSKPEQEDQFLLTDSMIEAGLAADQIERYNSGDQAPTLVCNYLLEAFRAARDLPGEPGRRMRAEFVRLNFATI